MAITTKTFTALVQSQAAAIQAQAAGLVDFSIGSILRAIVESVANVALWLQGQILVLLLTTRAATSSGADLDSWMADFSLTRLMAQPATGTVTFGRLSTTSQVVVPVGSTVQTADGTQTYTVGVDTTNPAYNVGLGGYVMAAGVASVNAPVTANTAGAAGNALAGAVTVITSAIPGVDTVTNGANFANGADAETDAAFRTRFAAYIASLSRATPASIQEAVQSVQQGAVGVLVENQTYGGSTLYGYGYVVVDDGSGAPPTSFINACTAAIAAMRGFTTRVDVFAPTVVTANWAMTLAVGSGYSKPAVATAVTAAVNAYINGLGLGNALHWSRLAQIAYDASPGVSNVSAVTINSGTSDISATAQQVVKAGTATVSTP